ncbi:MAG: DNA polymerase IV [Parcubacteria group bacterium Gr01-1014_20]|nr:MAG: DNA polymerase IV [Parcubacteria group bacterium Gr01-1014_20]
MMRITGHLDMDAFFAAVEERDRPRLKGRPIVVGSDPEDGRGRGVVSTANYKAREYGIHSAMPISKAWELSEKAKKDGNPPAVFISGSHRRYSEVSKKIFQIVAKHVQAFEQTSVDEGYLDLSFTSSYKKAETLAKKIQKEIRLKEKLTCSIGIGPNKLIAKIASDIQKPNGLIVLNEEDAENFIEPLSIRNIPGIGPKTEILLNKEGIKTVKDLKKFSAEKLRTLLGKWGTILYAKARGQDDSPVANYYVEAKSIGEQETFNRDSSDLNFITDRVKTLCGSVFNSFKKDGFKSFKIVVVTVRFSNFETKNRSRTLAEPANSLENLEFEALKLLYPFFDRRENPQKRLIRLVGIRIEKLK